MTDDSDSETKGAIVHGLEGTTSYNESTCGGISLNVRADADKCELASAGRS